MTQVYKRKETSPLTRRCLTNHIINNTKTNNECKGKEIPQNDNSLIVK